MPLWWDAGTLADIGKWREFRIASGAGQAEPLLASLQPGRDVKVFSRHTLRKRFRTACNILGREHLQNLTIHHGRHTFISRALAGGTALAEVQDAVRHANFTVTSGYLHAIIDEAVTGTLFT